MGNVRERRIDSHNHRIIKPQPVLLRAAELHQVKKNDLHVNNALVISLERSKDRLVEFMANNKFAGNLEVIEAVDGMLLPKLPEGTPLHPGDHGCLMSHKKALEYARDKNWPCVIIFEDDAIMVDGFTDKLQLAMAELPETWDLLWLGGSNAEPPYPYSKHLKALVQSWGTYGYVIREWCYDYFIDLFSEQKRSSDDYYRINHSRFRSFRTAENLVIHKKGVSDRILTNHLSKQQQ